MEILILTVFISVGLVIAALIFFAWNVHEGSHDHSERLALLPLEDDSRRAQIRSEEEGRS